jgi:tetratricopeptide (TPR) repeat protein
MTYATSASRAAAATIISLVGLLGGCASSSPEFVAPEQPRMSLAQKVDAAKGYAAQAQVAETEKRTDDAIALYRKAIDTYRDFPAAWHNLGLLQLEKNETLAAVESFKVAGDLDLRDPRPVFNIGVVYEKQGWSREAQRYYTEALTRDANYLDALRRSIYLDMVESTYTPATLDRTRRAMLLEVDPKWRAYFERQQIRLEAVLAAPANDPGVPAPTESMHDGQP